VEYTVDNAFNLRDLVLQESKMLWIYEISYCKNTRSLITRIRDLVLQEYEISY